MKQGMIQKAATQAGTGEICSLLKSDSSYWSKRVETGLCCIQISRFEGCNQSIFKKKPCRVVNFHHSKTVWLKLVRRLPFSFLMDQKELLYFQNHSIFQHEIKLFQARSSIARAKLNRTG